MANLYDRYESRSFQGNVQSVQIYKSKGYLVDILDTGVTDPFGEARIYIPYNITKRAVRIGEEIVVKCSREKRDEASEDSYLRAWTATSIQWTE